MQKLAESLGSGFPLNFTGDEINTAEELQHTRAAMLEGVVQATESFGQIGVLALETPRDAAAGTI